MILCTQREILDNLVKKNLQTMTTNEKLAALLERAKKASEAVKKLNKIDEKIKEKSLEIESINDTATGHAARLRVRLCTQREILVTARLEAVARLETLL